MNSKFETTAFCEPNKETIPESIIQEGEKRAKEIIAALHLPYHNEKHVQRVVENYLQIVMAIIGGGTKIDPRMMQIGILAAAFHDSVQNFTETANDPSGAKGVIRQRDSGQNEKSSVLPLFKYMDEENEKVPGTFTEEDKALAQKMIDVTVPKFENGVMIQKNLNETSSELEIALALADIGTAGMGPSEDFIREGNEIFREDNIDIAKAVAELQTGGSIDDTRKENFRSRMIAWSETQPKFAKSREDRFDTDTVGLTEKARHTLKTRVFKHFGRSIELATQKLEERRGLSFEKLLADMGYGI